MNIDPHKPASADEPGVRELYRELPQPQPSAELDQAILLAARQALQNDKVVQLPPRPWHKRLLLPLSIAATVVLSFGVVLRMSHEQAAQVVQLQHADIVQSQEQAAPAAVAPAPMPQPIEPAPRAESAPAASVARKALPPIVLPGAAEQKASPPAAQPTASDAAKELAPAPVAPPAAAPAAAPAVPPAPMPQAAPAAGESAGRVADSAAAGLAAGVPAAAPAAAVPMPARKALRAHEAVAIDPAISEIRRLLAGGERDKARAALLRYRAANPAVELPADLRQLLDEAAPAGMPPQ